MKLTAKKDPGGSQPVFLGTNLGDARSRGQSLRLKYLGELALPQFSGVRVQEREDEIVVRAAAPDGDQGLEVHVTSLSARNPVHRAYRALSAIGIQIAHSRVRSEGGKTLLTLHVTEPDDQSPISHRILEVLTALHTACLSPLLPLRP